MSEQHDETAPQDQSADEQTFPISLVRRETGRTHTVITNGVQQTVPIVHGETGEAEAEYVLLASINGVDVPLATYNAGRIETVVSAQQRAQQNQQA